MGTAPCPPSRVSCSCMSMARLQRPRTHHQHSHIIKEQTHKMIYQGKDRRGVFDKTTNGVKTMEANTSAVDRNVLLLVSVTEAFADGSGAQPTFQIGQAG